MKRRILPFTGEFRSGDTCSLTDPVVSFEWLKVGPMCMTPAPLSISSGQDTYPHGYL